MKNPLIKRLPRELKTDAAKYLVVFLFMTISIGLVSGALVAGNSMINAYQNSFDKYNVEDGNFAVHEQLSKAQITELEKEDVTLYENYYKEEAVIVEDENIGQSTLRIFASRDAVNRICLMEGELPKEENEIGIDRMYADNNAIAVGDIITVGENKLTVTGLVALSDYSALFFDNSDMMFDSVKFGVAVMTKEGFATYPAEDTTYDYSWKYESEPKDEINEKEKSDNFLTFLSQKVILEKYVPAYSNQAIQFTGGDLGSDRSMFIVLLYILITIIAFIFAITTNNTITMEVIAFLPIKHCGTVRHF